MTNTRQHNPSETFEGLVRALLEASGFDISAYRSEDAYADFQGIFAGVLWVVEVIHYRSSQVNPDLLLDAAERPLIAAIESAAGGAMLVVSTSVDEKTREIVRMTSGVRIVDREDLLAIAHDPTLFLAMVNFIRSQQEDFPSAITPKSLSDVLEIGTVERARRMPSRKDPEAKSVKLQEALRKIKCGKEHASLYEKTCTRILQYLFDPELVGWHEQQPTDDKLNRFDLVCRIKSNRDFWKFLSDHLNTRYVVFECKNYCTAITQGEILTTEKYLLGKALRNVAFVISRHGPSSSARAMMAGAMREHGKLIVTLSDADMVQMLQMKAAAEDPVDHLFNLVDHFLLRLSR